TSVQSLITTPATPISPASGPTEQPTPGVTLVVEVPVLPTVNVSVGNTGSPTSSGGGSIATPIPVTVQIGGGSTATPIPVPVQVPVQVGGGSTSSTPPPVTGNEGAPGAVNVPASTPAGNETTPPGGAVPAASATSSQGTPTGLAPSLGLSAPALAPPAASSANAPSLSLPTGSVAA